MGLSTSMIAGLSSGFDWRSMIDQLMAIEHRPVDIIEDKKSEYEEKLGIFQSINAKLLTLKTEAETLASSNAFNIFETSLSSDSSAYDAKDFVSVSTSTSAAPGSHTLTMNDNSTLAASRKISSKSFSTYDTALGVSGEFVINGRAVEVEATDDLGDIQDKINNMNAGSDATGINAAILTVAEDNYRLVLTSENTGEDAFTISDASGDADSILSTGLGFTDGSTSVKNLLSNGAQSEAFSNSTQSVSSMLGITTAQSGINVTIGSVGSITIDLSKSLTEIASDINTAHAATNVSASVVSTTEDGETTYRLKITNTTNFIDDNHVLETLGILEGDQGDVAEVHQGSGALYNDTDVLLDSDNLGADDLTTINMTDLRIAAGTSANVQNGDTIRVTGTKSDGTSVDSSGTVGTDFTTVSEFMAWVDTQFSSGGSPTNNVTVRFDNGLIKITDDNAGDSQLSIMITANNDNGGQLDFGTVSATTEGYSMQLQEGQDANVIINGTAVTSSTNVIDDVIPGLTLTLKTLESGSTVNLSVDRDYSTIKNNVQAFVNAYNDIIAEINAQFEYDEDNETAGLLQGDGTLHSIKNDLVNTIISSVTGVSSTLNALSLVGIATEIDYTDHSNDGKLSIDSDVFLDALKDDFNGVRRIFIAEGSTTDGDVEYVGHTNDTVAGTYTVDITQAATQASVTGSSDLTSGIGASNYSTLTVTQGSKIAAITLNGDSGEDGSSIENIVNAVNSELDSEYAQSIMGNVKNTTDAGQTAAIANTTTWDSIFSGGVAAGLSDGEEITFSGHKKSGVEVSGSYTITTAASDTVQGLLSAIESAYDYEVSAAINTYGYLVLTDKSTGNSSLDISITAPGGTNLDFGDVTTSNLVGSEQHTTGGGASAALETTVWSDIDDLDFVDTDVIYFSGYKASGEAVEGSYTVVTTETLGDLLSEVNTAFGSDVTEIQDGRIVLSDGTSNSTLGLTFFGPSGRSYDLGALSGGVTGRYSIEVTASDDGSGHLVLTHNNYGSEASFSTSQSDASLGLGAVTAGLDVEGTINGEAATGSGRVLTGDSPATDATTSIEGLAIKYTGASTGTQGAVKITMGIAELLDRALFGITDPLEGYSAFKEDSIQNSIDGFDTQIGQMEARLNRRMDMMINKFVAMEVALSQIQNMSSWLTSQLDAASRGWA